MIVLHYTGMADGQSALARLCDPASEVSAHYVIEVDGRVFQLVAEDQRAWHAGAGTWGNVSDVNSHSIGIEIVNCGAFTDLPPFPLAQMEALENLLSGIMARWSIQPERVIGHSDMAPGRKIDPGPKFDWQGLARAGLSVWPPEVNPVPVNEMAFRQAARSFGYCPATDDEAGWAEVLTAFRQRFKLGNLVAEITQADMGLITALAANFPCQTVNLGSGKV